MQLDPVELVINIALASCGGLVKRLLEIESRPPQNLSVFLSFVYYFTGSFISMFVGTVVYFLCKNYAVPQFLTIGITALAGYMGAPALDLLSGIVRKNLERRRRK